MLTLHRHPDARAFLTRAEQWLMTREIEHAGVLQSARQARADDRHYERPMYWTTIEDDDGQLVGYAYRTPPYKVGVPALPDAALAPLVADLAATYPGPIGGFSGPDPTVSRLAQTWVAQRGGSWSVSTGGRLLAFAAEGPAAGGGAAGTLRLASADDTALAQSWGAAASIDSGIAALDGPMCMQLLGAKMLYFWVDDQPRCMIGLLRETRDSVAIGIVYTPAAFRGQGYAMAAMSALNQLLDERGITNRYLWIDPKNDAAQALASKLGCRFVYDSLDIDCT